MTRILFLAALSVSLCACSLDLDSQFSNTSPPSSPPVSIPPTATRSEVPTTSPTLPTPTFTATPTLVGFKSATPSPDYSPTIPPTLITPNTPTPTVEMVGFVAITVSRNEFFKRVDCEPPSVKFSVFVADPAVTEFVVLFVRFKSKQTGTTSEWTSITMDNMGAGTFSHELFPSEMKAFSLFENAWVEYQLVSTDIKTKETGRTAIFKERLTLSDCLPTVTSVPSSTSSAIP